LKSPKCLAKETRENGFPLFTRKKTKEKQLKGGEKNVNFVTVGEVGGAPGPRDLQWVVGIPVQLPRDFLKKRTRTQVETRLRKDALGTVPQQRCEKVEKTGTTKNPLQKTEKTARRTLGTALETKRLHPRKEKGLQRGSKTGERSTGFIEISHFRGKRKKPRALDGLPWFWRSGAG